MTPPPSDAAPKRKKTRTVDDPICGQCGEYKDECTCAERISELETQLSSQVSTRDLIILDLKADLTAARARIDELTDALETIAATEEHHSSRIARKALAPAAEPESLRAKGG